VRCRCEKISRLLILAGPRRTIRPSGTLRNSANSRWKRASVCTLSFPIEEWSPKVSGDVSQDASCSPYLICLRKDYRKQTNTFSALHELTRRLRDKDYSSIVAQKYSNPWLHSYLHSRLHSCVDDRVWFTPSLVAKIQCIFL